MDLTRMVLIPLLLLGAVANASASVRYAISVRDVATRSADVEARFPASGEIVAGGEAVLYVPSWTPGYYVREEYKKNVIGLRAFDGQGRELEVEDAGASGWRVRGVAEGELVVRYTLSATERSVSRNEVAGNYAVFNGSSTYVAARGGERLAQEVALTLPVGWTSASGLRQAGGIPHHFVADDYEELVDSPIMAGDLQTLDFDSRGTPHHVVYNRGAVDIEAAGVVCELMAMTDATRAFWNEAPWRKYVFMVAFRDARRQVRHSTGNDRQAARKGSTRKRGSVCATRAGDWSTGIRLS